MLTPSLAQTQLNRPRTWQLVLGLAALVAGLFIARLPLETSAALLGGSALALAAVLHPVIGLSLALIFGPAKAFLAVARPDLPSDVGQIFFALALAGWGARGLLNQKLSLPHAPLLIPLWLYIAAQAFSLLPAVSLEEGLKEIVKWVELALGAWILVGEIERQRSLAKWVLGAVLVAGAAQALIGLWQFGLRPNGPEHFRILGNYFRAYGSFEQPNPYAGFLGLVWPLAAGLALSYFTTILESTKHTKKHEEKTFVRFVSFVDKNALWLMAWSALAALLLGGLYVSFSRGAWLGAAAAGLAMLMFWPKRMWLGPSLALGALLIGWALTVAGWLPASITARLADVTDFTTVTDVRGLTISDSNFALIERLAHWQAATDMARDHPWLGVGVGNYGVAYAQYAALNWPNALGHAHMIYLNVLAETGVVGLWAYTLLWATLIGFTMRLIHRADGLQRGLALGLLGAWLHLTVHQIFDNLYVNNLHFTLAALVALLIAIHAFREDFPLDPTVHAGA